MQVENSDFEIRWEDIEQLVTCSICCKTFNDPLTLSCLHTYCKECIDFERSKSRNNDLCYLCSQIKDKERPVFPGDNITFISRCAKIVKKRRDLLQSLCVTCKSKTFMCQYCFTIGCFTKDCSRATSDVSGCIHEQLTRVDIKNPITFLQFAVTMESFTDMQNGSKLISPSKLIANTGKRPSYLHELKNLDARLQQITTKLEEYKESKRQSIDEQISNVQQHQQDLIHYIYQETESLKVKADACYSLLTNDQLQSCYNSITNLRNYCKYYKLYISVIEHTCTLNDIRSKDSSAFTLRISKIRERIDNLNSEIDLKLKKIERPLKTKILSKSVRRVLDCQYITRDKAITKLRISENHPQFPSCIAMKISSYYTPLDSVEFLPKIHFNTIKIKGTWYSISTLPNESSEVVTAYKPKLMTTFDIIICINHLSIFLRSIHFVSSSTEDLKRIATSFQYYVKQVHKEMIYLSENAITLLKTSILNLHLNKFLTYIDCLRNIVKEVKKLDTLVSDRRRDSKVLVAELQQKSLQVQILPDLLLHCNWLLDISVDCIKYLGSIHHICSELIQLECFLPLNTDVIKVSAFHRRMVLYYGLWLAMKQARISVDEILVTYWEKKSAIHHQLAIQQTISHN